MRYFTTCVTLNGKKIGIPTIVANTLEERSIRLIPTLKNMLPKAEMDPPIDTSEPEKEYRSTYDLDETIGQSTIVQIYPNDIPLLFFWPGTALPSIGVNKKPEETSKLTIHVKRAQNSDSGIIVDFDITDAYFGDYHPKEPTHPAFYSLSPDNEEGWTFEFNDSMTFWATHGHAIADQKVVGPFSPTDRLTIVHDIKRIADQVHKKQLALTDELSRMVYELRRPLDRIGNNLRVMQDFLPK